MLVKEKSCLDDDENGLYVQNVDADGVQIVEKDGQNAVYVYYSEIDVLIEKLRYYKEAYFHNEI